MPSPLPGNGPASPGSDRGSAKDFIVLIGVSRFAAAHLGWAIEMYNRKHPDGVWGIRGFSTQTSTMVDSLRSGELDYVLVQGHRKPTVSIISAFTDVTFGPDDESRPINWIADPATRGVALTVSNSGYCTGANGSLDTDHEAVRQDMTRFWSAKWRTYHPYLLRGLYLRWQQGGAPIVVLSLDNREGNSETADRSLRDFGEPLGLPVSFWEWYHESVVFANTTVDRITPKDSPAAVQVAHSVLGETGLPVFGCEKYFQLVVEETARGLLPDLTEVGVEFASREEVDLWFERKGMVLNLGHMVTAALSMRAGSISHVHEAMKTAWIHWLMERFHMELSLFLGHIFSYAHDIRWRFATLPDDTIERVGPDTTRKVFQRLLPAILKYMEASRSAAPRALSFVFATWLINLGAVDEAGREITLADNRAESLRPVHEDLIRWAAERTATEAAISEADLAVFTGALTSIASLTGLRRFEELALRHPEVLREVAHWFHRIHTVGIEPAALELLTANG